MDRNDGSLGGKWRDKDVVGSRCIGGEILSAAGASIQPGNTQRQLF